MESTSNTVTPQVGNTVMEEKPGLIDPPGIEPKDCCLTPDKASGNFRMVVRWLMERTYREKLAAVALHVLLNNDTESNLRSNGRYAGNVGDDLDATWKRDAFSPLEGGQAANDLDAETLAVAAYVAGLDANY